MSPAGVQREGLIFKITGKGTFVSKNEPKAMQELSQLQGFGEAMHLLGREIRIEVNPGTPQAETILDAPPADEQAPDYPSPN